MAAKFWVHERLVLLKFPSASIQAESQIPNRVSRAGVVHVHQWAVTIASRNCSQGTEDPVRSYSPATCSGNPALSGDLSCKQIPPKAVSYYARSPTKLLKKDENYRASWPVGGALSQPKNAANSNQLFWPTFGPLIEDPPLPVDLPRCRTCRTPSQARPSSNSS